MSPCFSCFLLGSATRIPLKSRIGNAPEGLDSLVSLLACPFSVPYHLKRKGKVAIHLGVYNRDSNLRVAVTTKDDVEILRPLLIVFVSLLFRSDVEAQLSCVE